MTYPFLCLISTQPFERKIRSGRSLEKVKRSKGTMLVHGRNGKFLLIVDLDSDLIVIHVREHAWACERNQGRGNLASDS